MKQSTKVAVARQLALWTDQGDRVQPCEEIREELTRVLADLLLEALGVKTPTDPRGDADELEDHA